MRSAPAVAVQLHGSRRWDGASALLGGMAAAAFTATVSAHAGLRPSPSMACIGMASLLGAAVSWWARPDGRAHLRFDGQRWWLGRDASGEEQAGSVQVMIDAGRWMLLCFVADPGSPAPPAGLRGRVWLPVSERRVASSLALRAAVYSRAADSGNPA